MICANIYGNHRHYLLSTLTWFRKLHFRKKSLKMLLMLMLPVKLASNNNFLVQFAVLKQSNKKVNFFMTVPQYLLHATFLLFFLLHACYGRLARLVILISYIFFSCDVCSSFLTLHKKKWRAMILVHSSELSFM